MSSHHVIREKQEPALLVLGLDNFPDEMLGQLLEWSPTVITTPQTAEKLVAYGIKIDWIITNQGAEILQSDVKLMPCRNGNLIDAALSYLADNGFPAVNIITDELNINDYTNFAGRINLVIFNDQHKIYPVVPGFSKWKPVAELIRILNPPADLRFTGLRHLQGQVYQTINDGFFSLHFNHPFLFISEEL